MHKKIIYVSDNFAEHFQGGAELSDDVVVRYLASCGHGVTRVRSSNFTPLALTEQTFVISNFASLSEINKQWLINSGVRYIIIERDQKYVATRNTAMYKNFVAPKNQVVNQDFYAAAHKVFCLTEHSARLLLKHIDLNNVESLGCTQFSEEQFNILENHINNKKNNKFAIVSGKRSDLAKIYCQENNLEYRIIEKASYQNFIESLSRYKGLVFFSHAVETCCRLLVEARILNLKILTDKKNGCTYEKWFTDYKGRELLEYLKKEMPNNLKKIEKEL